MPIAGGEFQQFGGKPYAAALSPCRVRSFAFSKLLYMNVYKKLSRERQPVSSLRV